MANKRIEMLRIRKIIQLLESGMSGRGISESLRMGRHTLSHYQKLIEGSSYSCRELLLKDDHQLHSILLSKEEEEEPLLMDNRLRELEQRLASIAKELKRKGVTRGLLWQEYKKACPDGYGHSQFCEHLSRYLHTHHPSFHNEHVAAEVMQVDFAGDKLTIHDRLSGTPQACVVLVCTLPCSSFTYIEAMLDARQENLFHAMSHALEYLQGVPASVLSDNMKQYVTRANRYEPTFSHMAESWSVHYNVAILATRPSKPKDKAHVEGHVNIVYKKIYAAIRDEVFYSLEALNTRLWELLDEMNDARMYNRPDSRRERFEREEKPMLHPLPLERFVVKYRRQAKVMSSYHVLLGEDKHFYSVPYQHIGKQIVLVYDCSDVEVYLGLERIAIHRRNPARFGYTTLKEHMPASHAHYKEEKGWDADDFLGKAEFIGPATKIAIEKILSSRAFIQQSYGSCIGVFRLGKAYGRERLEAACKRLEASPTVRYAMIENILKKNLDQHNSQEELNYNLPSHENTRGADYYK